MTNAQTVRRQLCAAGYSPVVLYGKVPASEHWQESHDVTPAMLDMWKKTWPDARNTGVLTRTMPTLDFDILDEVAAKACQDFVRNRYGLVLVRTGKPPKFAIPFRTDNPFKKIVVNLIAADDSKGQKIEFLADGQQLVVDGIHPETKQPYHWSNGALYQIKHEHLSSISEDEARALVDELVEILVRDFGYKRAPSRTKANSGAAPKAHDGGGGGDRDWGALTENILTGRELHDSVTIFAAKLIASRMNSGAAVNYLRGLMDKSTAPKDDRWHMRVSEIPAAVDSAVEKYGKQTTTRSSSEPEAKPPPPSTKPPPASTSPIEDARAVFEKWLILPSPIPFYAMVSTVAANKLPGIPVWLGLVAPPSSAKTEMLNSLGVLPHVQLTGTLTEAALLSGVPKKQQATSAKGGLLREIGAFGILLLKDFGTILSMHPENKAKLLAAL